MISLIWIPAFAGMTNWWAIRSHTQSNIRIGSIKKVFPRLVIPAKAGIQPGVMARVKGWLIICLLCTSILAHAEEVPQSEVLSRESTSSNTSELFSKVMVLEENMREMNGKLQQYEHDNKTLSKRLDELQNKPAAVVAEQLASNNASDEKLFQAVQLLDDKKFDEAIVQLSALSEVVGKEKNHFATQGEVSYWLAKAHMGKGEHNKASAYLAKSYRYYSEIKANGILLKLIEVLAFEKKYPEACALLKKLDDKYVKTLPQERKKFIANLQASNCTVR